jgi:AraC-like DNA-binding protein
MSASDDLDRGRIARSQPIPHDLKKAVDHIRADLGRKISVAELVAHCGVPERTLRKHFHTFMGVSPLEFWRRLRLAAVREDLLKGANASSVTDAAARFGFTHFGRFSQQYSRCFGETPSATLQRSRLARNRPNVRILKEDLDGAGGLSIAARRSRERPSIAVLPCQVSAAEPDCRFFADYVTEGIATALCRVRSLSVVVPKSSRNFASRDPNRLSQ